MLDEIVKVKGYRLDSAKRELGEAKKFLAQCQQELAEHIKKVADYEVFMKSEKVRLFNKIENEKITLKEIDKYQLEISMMKSRLAELQNETVNFEKKVEDAEEALEKSRQNYQRCNVELQKYEEIGEEIVQDMVQEIQYKEEVELEDLHHKSVEERYS